MRFSNTLFAGLPLLFAMAQRHRRINNSQSARRRAVRDDHTKPKQCRLLVSDVLWRGFPGLLLGHFLTSVRVQEAGAEKLCFKVVNSGPAIKS
jgi:hypothetical protein